MSQNLRITIKDLAFVANIKCKKTQNCLLKYMSKDKKYKMAIKELALNIIKGNIKVDDNIKKHIRKYAHLIFKSKNPTRKLIIQSGGWLQWIVPIVVSLLEIVI